MRSSNALAIVGGTGQLGTDLARACDESGIRWSALGHDEIEVDDPASVERALGGIDASAVVNCAAFHQVDDCERDPGSALRVNALGALQVARVARRRGARTVFISTDYVFDGTKDTTIPYVEADRVGPINVYGAAKLAGEALVAAADPDALVVRVAGLYGRVGSRGKGGTNFVETILSRAAAGRDLEVVDDQYASPTCTLDAARAIVGLISAGARGTIHVANTGICTWYEFAAACLELAGARAEIRPVKAASRATIARRPRHSALGSDHVERLLGARLPPWREALAAYLAERSAA